MTPSRPTSPPRGASGQSPEARETRVMPETKTSREAMPEGWPATPPTYRSTHGGWLAVAHLVALVALVAAVAWCAVEVRDLRNSVAAKSLHETEPR